MVNGRSWLQIVDGPGKYYNIEQKKRRCDHRKVEPVQSHQMTMMKLNADCGFCESNLSTELVLISPPSMIGLMTTRGTSTVSVPPINQSPVVVATLFQASNPR